MINNLLFIEGMRRLSLYMCDKEIEKQQERFENPRINTPLEMIGQVLKLIVLGSCFLFVGWIFINLFLMAVRG